MNPKKEEKKVRAYDICMASRLKGYSRPVTFPRAIKMSARELDLNGSSPFNFL
jgi:hypothetical protein